MTEPRFEVQVPDIILNGFLLPHLRECEPCRRASFEAICSSHDYFDGVLEGFEALCAALASEVRESMRTELIGAHLRWADMDCRVACLRIVHKAHPDEPQDKFGPRWSNTRIMRSWRRLPLP